MQLVAETTVDASKGAPMLEPPAAVRLDNPIGRKEAKSRGIDATLSRLLIDGERNVLAELVYRCCPRSKKVFIHAVGQLTSLEKVVPAFKGSNIEVFAAPGFLSANDKDQVDLVFARWSAEILVAFFADQETANQIVESLQGLHPKWWKLTQEGYEAPYLKQLRLADPFFFFSPTRSSLEVIGTGNRILECFDHVRRPS